MTKNDVQPAIEFKSSQTLEQTITSFKSATTAQDRQALLDQVITAWANTSSMGDAKARNPLPTNSPVSNGGGWYVSSPAQAIADFAQKQPVLYAQLSALERFNGQSVIERYTRATNASYYDAATGSYKGYTLYSVSIEPQRLPFFQAAYDSLKASTYQSLYLQTEGKALLDSKRQPQKNYYQYRSCLRSNLLGFWLIQHSKTSCNAGSARLGGRSNAFKSPNARVPIHKPLASKNSHIQLPRFKVFS